jgi:hypothetical protein
MTTARTHVGRDLVQIRERLAELDRPPTIEEAPGAACLVMGEIKGLRYAEKLLVATLARPELQPSFRRKPAGFETQPAFREGAAGD